MTLCNVHITYSNMLKLKNSIIPDNNVMTPYASAAIIIILSAIGFSVMVTTICSLVGLSSSVLHVLY